GVAGTDVVVDAVAFDAVPGGDDEQGLGVGAEGFQHRFAGCGGGQRDVGDAGPVSPRVVDRADDRFGRADEAVRFAARRRFDRVGADPQRHDPRVPGDAGGAEVVVADGADDPRRVDAVAAGDEVVVGRVAGSFDGRVFPVFADEVGA